MKQHVLTIDRHAYEQLKKKYRLRIRYEQLGLIAGALSIFLLLLYFGSIPAAGEEILLRNYAGRFWQEGKRSLALIFPAVIVTVLLAVFLGLLNWSAVYWQRRFQAKKIPLALRPLYWGCAIMSQAAVVFSSIACAIPLFISAIFIIQFMRLDTVNDHNFFYGILCLAAFNVNYFYKRSRQKIQQAYSAQYVLFARSTGINEKKIFRYYVLPRIICDNLVILRELLPHIVVESIIIEYTFSYNALLRSAIQSIRYQNWYYFAVFVYAFILFIALFNFLCRCLEDYFSPPETQYSR